MNWASKNNEANQTALQICATRGLPARLDVIQTARLLGFAEHDIQILTGAGLLKPLGSLAPNAPKWFSAMGLILLAADEDWLSRATKELAKYWKRKREQAERKFEGLTRAA